VSIADSNAASTQFIAPLVTRGTDMLFKLTVTDPSGAQDSKRVHIFVNAGKANSKVPEGTLTKNQSFVDEQKINPSISKLLENSSPKGVGIGPNSLKVGLIENATGLQHEMVLTSYSGSGEKIDTSRSAYPKPSALTLQRGMPITVSSLNPIFTFVPNSITLYDKNGLATTLPKLGSAYWSPDVPVGVYNLEVKGVVAPGGGTATFIDKIRIKESALDIDESIQKNFPIPDLEKLSNEK
jgi:hypothetical protein